RLKSSFSHLAAPRAEFPNGGRNGNVGQREAGWAEGLMRRLTVPFVLCFFATTPCLAADDRAACDSAKGDEAINACSRLLASGKDSGRALAAIYRNRCAAWNGKREPDRAIADCNDAIRHDSGHVAAYIHRGFAWRLKTNHDRALADYNEAIRLDAKSA